MSDQPESPCAGQGVGTVFGMEFAKQVGDVFFHGVEANHQLFCNLLVGCAGVQKTQHIKFAGGQRFNKGGFLTCGAC